MNKRLEDAFARPEIDDDAADFISETERAKKPSKTKDGKESVSARSVVVPMSVAQAEALRKLSFVNQASKAQVMRDALDLYIKRNKKDIERYDAFFGGR